MPVHHRLPVDMYIRGLETDYEKGLKVPGLSILENEYITARRVEHSDSVNTNSVFGEPPSDKLDETIRSVLDFYGSKAFSWIIKSNAEYAYLENALRHIGMSHSKTFSGMFLQLQASDLKDMSVQEVDVTDATSEVQINDLVTLTCEIFNIDANERENMVRERMAILDSPLNRSGFNIVYIDGRPVGYSRYRISSDGMAMYLTGSGVLKEFRRKHIYHSLLNHRLGTAVKKGCKLITVLASEETSKPILERLGFKTNGKYLFMTRKES